MSSKQQKQARDIYTQVMESAACHKLPQSLAGNIIEKVEEVDEQVFRRSDTTFLDVDVIDPNLILEIVERLEAYGHSKENIESRVFGVARFAACKNRVEKELAEEGWDITIIQIPRLSDLDIEELRRTLKNKIGVVEFDAVAGNPPYQKNDGAATSATIWDDFFHKVLSLVKEDGYLCLVHPGTWRAPYGAFEDVKKKILERDLQFLSVHHREVGKDVFGQTTSFDYYVLQNTKVSETSTTIEFTDETEARDVDVSDLEFIPNRELQKLEGLVSYDPSNRVNLIQDSSYHTQRGYTNDTETEEFCYPVVYSITQRNGINLKYSSTNENGHFGIPKVLWSNGTSYPVVDEGGEYAVTEFSYAIADDPDVLPKIKEAMNSEEFLDLMKAVALNDSHNYNYKVISTFRKDFWKEFVDEE